LCHVVDSAACVTTEKLEAAPPERAKILWKSLAVLFKVQIVLLLLFAAAGGAFLAAGGWPGTGPLILLSVTGGLAAAGASAINQYLEKGLDARMERTRARPLAAGALARSGWVLYAGVAMILVPALVVLPFNPALALFVLLGAAIYVAVYTVWLKPRTPLNIVIGGAAGAAAVLSGSAAAGNWHDVGALLLALLVFVWTPTHFWSLAMAYRDDYARGGFPMLPVQTRPRAAAGWILLHSSGVAVAAVALATRPALDGFYLIPAGLATLGLLGLNIRLIVKPGRQRALALFHASNLYLALVLLMVCVSTLVA
jgi:protoheme IX farnesyltransferase